MKRYYCPECGNSDSTIVDRCGNCGYSYIKYELRRVYADYLVMENNVEKKIVDKKQELDDLYYYVTNDGINKEKIGDKSKNIYDIVTKEESKYEAILNDGVEVLTFCRNCHSLCSKVYEGDLCYHCHTWGNPERYFGKVS